MHFLLVLLFLLIPFLPSAQSARSDSLYAAGVDLYNQGRYADAIPFFEQSNALDIAEIDSASVRHDYSAAWLASCHYRLGNEDKAIELDRYQYRFTPVDRRLTVEIDKVQDDAIKQLKANNMAIAIERYRRIRQMELEFYADPDHYAHIMTSRMLGACYASLGNPDEAARNLNESIRLIQVNYGPTDTLQLDELNFLGNIYFSHSQFDNALQVNARKRPIVEANFGCDHVRYLDIEFNNIVLLLMQRRWDEAHDALPAYMQLLVGTLGQDPDLRDNAVVNIRALFDNCGRAADCEYIDNFVANTLPDSKNFSDFQRKIILLSDLIPQRKTDDIQSILQELKSSGDLTREQSLIVQCFECYMLMIQMRLDEAKELYIDLQKNLDKRILENNQLAGILYNNIEMSIGLALGDYETAAAAINRSVASVDTTTVDNNLSILAQQAAINAIAGKYDKAKGISKNAVARLRQHIDDPRALYWLERDTAQINQVFTLFDTHIRYAENLNDSAKYVLRDIKAEYLLLKADLMRNVRHFELDYDYYESVSDYALELLRMHKYPEAQDVMNAWLDQWHAAFDAFDKDTDNPDEQLALILGVDALEDGLRFRARRCYEKGDPAGYAAHEDLLKAIAWIYDDGELAEEYRQAKIDYLDYRKDYPPLRDYILSLEANDSVEVNFSEYKAMADACEKLCDFDRAADYWKKMVREMMTDPHLSDYRDGNAYFSINKIIEYYARTRQDTLGLLQYYEQELWPLTDAAGPRGFEYFVKSIDWSGYYLQDALLIPAAERKLSGYPAEFLTPERMAAFYQAVAGMLIIGRYTQELALEYLKRGHEFVKDDPVLDLLFGCYEHKVAAKCPREYRDDNVRLGYQLLAQSKNVDHFTNTPQYDNLINRQMGLLAEAGRYDEALSLGRQYLADFQPGDIDRRVYLFGADHPLHSSIGFINEGYLNDIALLEDRRIREQVFVAQSMVDPNGSVDYALGLIHNDLAYLATTISLNDVSTGQCDDLISLTSKLAGRFASDSLRMYAYDAALLCKGLQLRSTNAIHAIIRRSGHKGALRKFEELQAVLRELPAAKGGAQDSLVSRRDELERDLHRLSSSFGDYKRQLYTSWRDVQAAMAPGDLAVEFTHAASSYSDPESLGYKYGYYACVLGPKMSAPQIIFLAETDSITPDVDNYTSPALSQLLLTKLKPYLKGVKNLYYSPIGAFSQISLESLPLPEAPDKTLASKFNLYRLSSTREIIRNGLDIEGSGAVVYGGLRYDTSVEQMANDARKYNRDISLDQIVSLTNDDLSDLRGHVRTIQPLPGTQEEAESIVGVLNSAADTTLRATPMIGDVGTEASFKSLGGRQKRVIHLSTHGFYFSQREFDQISARDEERTRLNNEDKTLKRSGLFLAGAANKYEGREIPAGVDDGILTSQEIAGIDLTGLDLCVLSACQTAQGDITSEGVMGLQRGFKKAGAKSILMSLWKVDDEATCHMMKEFYRHWIADGKTKYQALELAKQSVRARTDKGWDDPHFWAAFILLDAPDL